MAGMVRRDPQTTPFGAPEGGQSPVATEEVVSDNGLADQLSTEPKNKGVLSRAAARLRERGEKHGVELPSGHVVSAIMGQFLREHATAQFIGTEIQKFAFEQGGGGESGGRWVLYRSDRHAGCQSRISFREFCRVPKGDKDLPEIWMAQNNRCLCVGHKLAKNLLERLRANGALTDEGARLLSEPIADELAVSESSMVRTSSGESASPGR